MEQAKIEAAEEKNDTNKQTKLRKSRRETNRPNYQDMNSGKEASQDIHGIVHQIFGENIQVGDAGTEFSSQEIKDMISEICMITD